MSRAHLAVTALVLVACEPSPLGRLCQPSDSASCGEGYQCLTFCNGDESAQSVCAPSFGKEAPATLKAEAVVNSRATYGEVANVKVMNEGLRIEITGIAGVAFPLLEEVSGNLTIIASDIECVSMPKLKRVGGVLTIDANPNLARIDLSSLAEADSLAVTDNDRLEELPLTGLRVLAGTLAAEDTHVIEENGQLADVDLAALTTIGGTLRVRQAGQVSLDSFSDGCLDVHGFDPDNACPATVDGECAGVADVTSCCACADCSAPPTGCPD